MERRIKFLKGEQRKFLKLVMKNLNSPSLRALRQFGFDIPYSTLKNYYTERRLIPESIFKDLLKISKISESEIKIKYLKSNWSQIKGGEISRRNFKNF